MDTWRCSFTVLMDLDNQRADAFHVAGLPKHLLIGSDRYIRFNQLRYRVDERFLDELLSKIELSRELFESDARIIFLADG